VPLKYVTNLVKRGGKHFVSVYTPLGVTDVEHPTTFEPDDQYEIGPFDSEQEAKKQQTKTEDELRKHGKLWIPTHEFKAKKKAKEKRKNEIKQKPLF